LFQWGVRGLFTDTPQTLFRDLTGRT